MSRRKKNLRAFRHQHPANDMTIEETWDAAWEGAQKHYHSKRMQELEAELTAVRGLLKIARCPNTECCLGSIPHQVGDHEWIAQQCQFCHERELLQERRNAQT